MRDQRISRMRNYRGKRYTIRYIATILKKRTLKTPNIAEYNI